MNKKLMIGVAALLTALFVFVPLSGAAGAESADFAKTAKAAVMLDADTGTVVYEKNAKEHLPIASMVKIMTLCVAFDEIEARGLSLDTMIPVSETAASMGGSQAFLDNGSSYRLDELLKSIVVASANDSCVAVAEYLSGSVDAFVSQMNAKAAELGMTDTVFVNCTGLPKDGQYSCASDVSIMFRRLIEHEKFFDYAKVWMYDFQHPSGRTTELTNTNKLVRFYDGCDGGKTGYTDAARSCVTVTAKRGDTRLICAVVGAENSKTRNKEVSELLNYGFANYKTEIAVRSGDAVGEYAVENGKSGSINVTAAGDVSVFVKSGDKCEISVEPRIDAIKAPVKAGDVVGEIVVSVNGEEYGRTDAVAASDCAKKGYLDIVDDFIGKW